MSLSIDCVDSAHNPFSFKEITFFDWDNIYVFSEYMDKEFISKTLGFEWNCKIVEDKTMRLVFVKDNSVIKFFDYPHPQFKMAIGGCDSSNVIIIDSSSSYFNLKTKYGTIQSNLIINSECENSINNLKKNNTICYR